MVKGKITKEKFQKSKKDLASLELEKKVSRRTGELENSRKALMNMLEDIDEERERAEDEKNKTLALITNFSDGLLFFDEDNRLTLVNPQAEKFLDVESDRIIGRYLFDLIDSPNIRPLIELMNKGMGDIFRKELPLSKKLILEFSTLSVTREKEKIGTLVILHDISREKMVEAMKTEFVSLAAHQLRTPLAAIKWTLIMLLDGDLGEITKEQREYLQKTYQSNERMISLINDLLNVTRIEEGRYLYKPAFADFVSICQFVINSYKDEIKRKNIKFEFKKPFHKIPEVQVDVEKIRLAVSNLLDNAVHYTPSGGSVTISLDYDKNKKEINFSIKDTGIGIPAEQKERIFSKFFRGANVIRMETEGSGLGLFIVKNIIEAHGGRIWFESEEGKGTIFYLNLPVKKEFEEFLKGF